MKNLFTSKISILLIFITFIASLVRIWNLSNNPAGLFVDEASIGLNAYYILTTGKDTYGTAFPIFFQSLGDYKDPVMIYSTVPFIFLFGADVFAIRIVSALYGIGAVILMYLMIREISQKPVAIFAMILLAVSPWHIHFSRVGFQLISTVFWLLFAFYFFYKSFKNPKWYFVSSLGFIMTFFTYSTVKLYLIPLFILLFICYWNETRNLLKSKIFWIVNVFSIVFVSLLIYPSLKDGTFFARWKQVQDARKLSKQEVITSYLNHFTSEFLFIKGDSGFNDQPVQRHSIPGVGELYSFQLPFIVWGIGAIFFVKKYRNLQYYIWFLLLYPLGTIFTDIAPQATRSILGVIPFQVLTAVGLYSAYEQMISAEYRKLYVSILMFVLSLSSIQLFLALQQYPYTSSDYWGWQYGYRPALAYFKQHEEEYDELLVTHRFNMGNEVLKYHNLKINCSKCTVMTNPIAINIEKRQLYALRKDDIEEAKILFPEYKFILKETIYLPNGEKELYIGEFFLNESS